MRFKITLIILAIQDISLCIRSDTPFLRPGVRNGLLLRIHGSWLEKDTRARGFTGYSGQTRSSR